MRLLSIASGSSGNCIYVGNDNTHILIDAGISKKRIEEGLNKIGITLSDINGILVTHEHSDHIKSLGVLLRKCDIPVYSSKETIEAIFREDKIGKVDKELFCGIEKDTGFKVNELTISPFSISHDAANPLAYRIIDDNLEIPKKVAIATDMGCYNDYIIDNLSDLDALLVEANHDIRMLQTGSYPYYLKQRILGNCGHLCNEVCGKLIDKILNDKIKKVFLGHLSHENNYPDLALQSVKLEIDTSDSVHKAKEYDIEVARRDMPSSFIEF